MTLRIARPARVARMRGALFPVVVLLLISACAPSDVHGDAAHASDGAVEASPIPEFDIPEGADLQSVELLYKGVSSLEELVMISDVIVTAHPVELVGVEGITPGPTDYPSDAPDFKRVPPHTIAQTTFRLQIDQKLKGALRPREAILIAETGRLDAPLMRANTQYLIFLVAVRDDPGYYAFTGGAANGRYVVAPDGVIELSVPNLDGPRAGYGYQEQFVGKRLRDVEKLFRK